MQKHMLINKSSSTDFLMQMCHLYTCTMDVKLPRGFTYILILFFIQYVSGGPFNPCTDGNPLTDASGNRLFCGRGPSRVDCPQGSSCNIAPNDAYAVCCPEFNPCTTGTPLTDTSGNRLFCGRGPSRVDCPPGSSCNIAPNDAYAVCCPGSIMNTSLLEDYNITFPTLITCFSGKEHDRSLIYSTVLVCLLVICTMVCCCLCKKRSDSKHHSREANRRKQYRNMYGCLMVAVITDLLWTSNDVPVKGPPSYEDSIKNEAKHGTENDAPPPYHLVQSLSTSIKDSNSRI